jgi:hypothetical protein
MATKSKCAICGETFTANHLEGSAGDNSVAEMYDPGDLGQPSVLVHASCGVARGLEVA